MAEETQPKVQVWKFTQSQNMLLEEQARQHHNEIAPFTAYQSRSRNDLLNSFRDEFNIPEGVKLNVDLDTRQFTERPDAPAGPVEVESETPATE